MAISFCKFPIFKKSAEVIKGSSACGRLLKPRRMGRRPTWGFWGNHVLRWQGTQRLLESFPTWNPCTSPWLRPCQTSGTMASPQIWLSQTCLKGTVTQRGWQQKVRRPSQSSGWPPKATGRDPGNTSWVWLCIEKNTLKFQSWRCVGCHPAPCENIGRLCKVWTGGRRSVSQPFGELGIQNTHIWRSVPHPRTVNARHVWNTKWWSENFPITWQPASSNRSCCRNTWCPSTGTGKCTGPCVAHRDWGWRPRSHWFWTEWTLVSSAIHVHVWWLPKTWHPLSVPDFKLWAP